MLRMIGMFTSLSDVGEKSESKISANNKIHLDPSIRHHTIYFCNESNSRKYDRFAIYSIEQFDLLFQTDRQFTALIVL